MNNINYNSALNRPRRLIIGISGATGVIYGIRLLEILKIFVADIETHLIISKAAYQTIKLETEYEIPVIKKLAHFIHPINDIAANIASGSFLTDGMIILPCAIKTLAGIVYGYNDNLMIRAADVILKERRPLIIAIRETPLHLGHLRTLTQAAELGAIIFPPLPAFYHKPKSITDVIDHTVNRILDQLNINLPEDFCPRWEKPNV